MSGPTEVPHDETDGAPQMDEVNPEPDKPYNPPDDGGTDGGTS